MVNQVGIPHPCLQKYISQYLHMEYIFPNGIQSPCIPRGLCALMFVVNEVKSRTICRDTANNTDFKFGEVYLFGQATEVQWVTAHGTIDVLYAVLQPLALDYLMHEQAFVFTDKVVALSGWYPQCKTIIEQLQLAKNITDQLCLLNTFFIELFKPSHAKIDEINNSLYHIFQSNGLITVEELAAKERVSKRTLQRKFADRVGMSPKSYARTIRFRSLMQHLLSHPKVSLLDLACLFNYHDHSHLIKDFYHFTGNSPVHYLKQEQIVDSQFLKYL